MFRTPTHETTTAGGKQNHQHSDKPNDKLVILADLALLEFPLEALKLFHKNQSLSSVSRDFSLQFIYNRCFPEKENGIIFQ